MDGYDLEPLLLYQANQRALAEVKQMLRDLDVLPVLAAPPGSTGINVRRTPDIDSGGARRSGKHWQHIKVPEHLFYFSERTLVRLIEQQGFKVVAVHREVEGTGLLEAVGGGQERARRLYQRMQRNP